MQVFRDMVGQVFSSVTADNDLLTFKNANTTVTFIHDQACCESVYIESIVGHLIDLIGEPLLMAEEVDGEIPAHFGEDGECDQWTFYKFATRKGYVDVRWYGTSNGYYSTDVTRYVVNVTQQPRPHFG